MNTWNKRTRRKAGASFIACTLLFGSLFSPSMQAITYAADDTPKYLLKSLTPEQRADDLLSRMTLDEKIGQMVQSERKNATPEEVKNYKLGSVLSGGGSLPDPNTPEAWANMIDGYQKSALDTRLHIPILYGVDAVHGHNNVEGAVIFPHNIGLGAANDTELNKQIGEAVAEEVRATGIHWTFAPTVAVPLDERWGRTYEGFGETPELVGPLGAAYVKGLQGEQANDDFMKGKHIVATAKHWVGDGATMGGIDQGNVEMSEEELRVYMEPFKEAIDAGVGSIMISLSSWNGVFSHGDKHLVQDILKDEFQFTGIVISDWNGISSLASRYSFSETNLSTEEKYRKALEMSVNAGIDMFMMEDSWRTFIPELKKLVNEKKVTEARIDDAVYRILLTKFKAGLFENPYTDRTLLNANVVGSDQHREIAREAVRKSAVLLKNERKKDGKQVLPLSKNSRIFVAGQHADDIGLQSGGWTISWQGQAGDITTGTTLLEGIQKVAPKANVTYNAEGRGAAGHDVAVVVIGEKPYAEMMGDDQDLSLTKDEIIMLKRVQGTGVPTVVVMMSGRPMIIADQVADWDAFIAAWLPGTEADGIAELLFGNSDFSGKLPVSWPWYNEQIPMNVGDENIAPLFPFGYGMTLQDAPKPLPPRPEKPEPKAYSIPGKIEAENYFAMNNVGTENTSDSGGGKNVGWINAGSWMDYRIEPQERATYRLDLRVASQDGAAGAMKVKSGNLQVTKDIPRTGGWQSWETVSMEIVLNQGPQNFRVTSGASGWNFNWFTLTRVGDAPAIDPDPEPQPDPVKPPVIIPNAVESWYTSEESPSDYTWYFEPKDYEYRMTPQPKLDLTEKGDAAITNINVNPKKQYQSMLGVGSSLEESTVYNLSLMSPDKRHEVLTKLVDPEKGAGMNVMRIAFGTADFTGRTFYSYNDMPKGETDPTLEHFSIQKDIDFHIIQTVKDALEINPDLKIFATPWSPPGWMKTSDSLVAGKMKDEYIDILAVYYRKAIQAYEEQGIPIYGMTLQNEPLLEINYPSMGMTPAQQKKLVVALKKELGNYEIDTKLWAFDHNFSEAFSYMTPIMSDPKAYDAIDGIAFHDYSGEPSIMTEMHNEYPEKDVLLSERSVWGTAGADRIAQYFRNWAIAYNGWVTMLDSNIEPEQWTGTPDPTMLIQNAGDRDDYWATPEFYITGQFAKFIQRGAKRIESNYGSAGTVTNVAFLNPDHTIVMVVINQSSEAQWFKATTGKTEFQSKLPAKTVATYKWNYTTDPIEVPAIIQAEDYNRSEGVTAIEGNGDAGRYLGNLEDGSFVDYVVKVPADGEYEVSYQVASQSQNPNRSITFLADDVNLGELTVPTTWDWENWKTIKHRISLTEGNHVVKLQFAGGEFNLDRIQFKYAPESVHIPGKIEGEHYRSANGAYIDNVGNGGFYLGGLHLGSEIQYDVHVQEEGLYPVSFRVATEKGDQARLVLKNGETVLAEVNLPQTGGWQEWQTVTLDREILLSAGNQQLTVEVQGDVFNLDWMAIGKSIVTTAPGLMEGTEDGKSIIVDLPNQSFSPVDIKFWQVTGLPVGITSGEPVQGPNQIVIPLHGNREIDYDHDVAVTVTAEVYGSVPEQGLIPIETTTRTENVESSNDSSTVEQDTTFISDTVLFKAINDRESVSAEWNNGDYHSIVLHIDGGNFSEANAGDITLSGTAVNDSVVSVTNVVYQSSDTVEVQLKWNQTDIRERLTLEIQVPISSYDDSTDGNTLTAELIREGEGESAPYTQIPGKIEAENYTLKSGATTEQQTPEGTIMVMNKRNWLEYRVHVPETGDYMLSFRVSSNEGASQGLQVTSNGKPLITQDIMQLWNNNVLIKGIVHLEEGDQTLRIQNAGAGTYRINWFEVLTLPSPLNVPGKIEAEDFNTISKGAIQDGSNGEAHLGFLAAGDTIDYKVKVAKSGEYKVDYRVATAQSGVSAELLSGDQVLLTTAIPSTGGWSSWKTVSDKVQLNEGEQNLRIRLKGDGFNLDWITFTGDEMTDPDPNPNPDPKPNPNPDPGNNAGNHSNGSTGGTAEQNATTPSTIKLNAERSGAEGVAIAQLTKEQVTKAMNQVTADKDDSKKLFIDVNEVKGATAYRIIFEKGSLELLSSFNRLGVRTKYGSYEVSPALFPKERSEEFSLNVASMNGDIIIKNTKDMIKSRPVVAFRALLGDQNVSISDQAHPIDYVIPYELSLEDANHGKRLKVISLQSADKWKWVSGASYDAQQGAMIFSSVESGIFGVALPIQMKFTDLTTTPWAIEAIETLVGKGIVNGVSATNFHPEKEITRADFVLLLMRALGTSSEKGIRSSFEDVGQTKYYAEAIASAEHVGLITGLNARFRPEESMTRQEMAVIIDRALTFMEEEVKGTASSLSSFTDEKDVASYAKEAMTRIMQLGILQGSGNKLHPRDHATRAETAVIIYRMTEL